MMDVEFDSFKNEANIARHGIALSDFKEFDAEPSVFEDNRFDYGEIRYIAVGRIGGLGYSLVFTMRGKTMRLISFRRAHEKEMRRYE